VSAEPGAPGDLGRESVARVLAGEDGPDLVSRVRTAAQRRRGERDLAIEVAFPDHEFERVAVGVELLLADAGGDPVGEIGLGELGGEVVEVAHVGRLARPLARLGEGRSVLLERGEAVDLAGRSAAGDAGRHLRGVAARQAQRLLEHGPSLDVHRLA
jgi:hypothetical protein